MERRDFLKVCGMCFACLAVGGYLGYDYTRKNPFWDINYEAKIKEGRLYVVDFLLVDHCNLKCKYCNHFSSIAKENFYNIEQFKKDINIFSKVVDKNVEIISLLGGEPLLHPKINDFIKIARDSFPSSKIDVMTNGILLNSMPESFWKTLSDTSARITPSIYRVKINWSKILQKAKKYNVKIVKDETDYELNLEDFNKRKINYFSKLNIDPKGTQTYYHTLPNNKKCMVPVPTVKNGKIYPCYMPIVAHILNENFNTNLVEKEGDYLDLYKAKNFEEIYNFVYREIERVPFCRYCGKITCNVPWENSEIHSKEEWIGV